MRGREKARTNGFWVREKQEVGGGRVGVVKTMELTLCVVSRLVDKNKVSEIL